MSSLSPNNRIITHFNNTRPNHNNTQITGSPLSPLKVTKLRFLMVSSHLNKSFIQRIRLKNLSNRHRCRTKCFTHPKMLACNPNMCNPTQYNMLEALIFNNRCRQLSLILIKRTQPNFYKIASNNLTRNQGSKLYQRHSLCHKSSFEVCLTK
jgi:hypothetical protein